MVTRSEPRTAAADVLRALDAGVERAQIRIPGAPARLVAGIVSTVCRGRPELAARLLVNDRLDLAVAMGLGGVHLPASGLPPGRVRSWAPPHLLVAVSTHSVRDVERAAAAGADFVVFGPVFPTASKPGHGGTGPRALAEAARVSSVPVFAIGGVSPARLDEVAASGAGGVAGISVFADERSLAELMERMR